MRRGKRVAATLAATSSDAVHSIQIVADRRRVHDRAVRERVTAEVLMPGACVQEVARRHGICTSLIYRWRRKAAVADGSAGFRLLPVRIADEPTLPATQDGRAPVQPALIEIEFADGVRMRVAETVSVPALRRMLAVLRW